MREITIMALVRAEPDVVYERLADFPGYIKWAPSVRSVEMSDDRATSKWEVTFRDGILRWTEEDRYDPVARRIEFHQIAGDMECFDGWWSVTVTPEGTQVTFYGTFDLGLPGLAEFLEPVAATALEENITELIGRLFVADAEFVSIERSYVHDTSPQASR